MESTHPQSDVRPRKRFGRTKVLLVGALGAVGLWTLQAGSWLVTPDNAPRDDRVETDADHTDRAPAENAAKQIELASHEAVDPSGDAPGTNPDPPESDETRGRRQVVGDWEDDYQGHRHLTVRADGTATMVVEPSGIGRKLFAERLTFDIEWSFADGKIVMLTTGGEPKSKTNLIINLYGTRAEYKLLNLNEKELVLLDADGKTKYEWRRMKNGPRDP